MMQFKLHCYPSLIISYDAWKFLKNEERRQLNVISISEQMLEKLWSRAFRNAGANPKTHPISNDEIRIDDYSFVFKLEKVKQLLTENDLTYRDDGFIIESFD